ncbi:hypothetical protein ACC684_38630, partial [Rhizobium ruizarguesonis]
MYSSVAEQQELTPEINDNTPPLEELLKSPERFINREFSLLQFNRRVLEADALEQRMLGIQRLVQ